MSSNSHTSFRRGFFVVAWSLLAAYVPPNSGRVAAQALDRQDGDAATVLLDGPAPDAPDIAEGKPSYVTTHDVSGKAGEIIALGLTVQSAADGGVPSVYLLNVPNEALIADASHVTVIDEDRATVDVTGWNLAELTISVPTRETRSYLLGVAALSHPDDGGPVRTTHAAFTVAITAEERADAEPPAGIPARPTTEMAAPTPVATPERRVAEPALRPEARSGTGGATRPDESTGAIARPPRMAAASEMPAPAPGPGASAATPPPAVAARAAPPPGPSPDTKPLIDRATRLIKLGDISGARLFLERGMALGDRQATFLLAQTYDPRVLRSWNVQGLRPDPARASVLYEQAAQREPADPRVTADARR